MFARWKIQSFFNEEWLSRPDLYRGVLWGGFGALRQGVYLILYSSIYALDIASNVYNVR